MYKDNPKIESYLKNLVSPKNYLEGISSSIRYNPEKVNFFSRLKCTDITNLKPIVHYRFNLIFSLKGSIQIHIDNKTVTLHSGESLLLFPYQNHHYIPEKDSEILWYFIGFEMKEKRGLESLRYKTIKITPYIMDTITQIINASDNLKVSLVTTILNILLDSGSNSEIEKEILQSDTNTVISQVQKLIYSDLRKNWTVSMLADEIGVSESFIYKKFKQYIGVSPGKYLSEVKINYACSIIEDGKYNLTEVAHLCGFDTIYTFSRTFKNITGFSPSKLKLKR